MSDRSRAWISTLVPFPILGLPAPDVSYAEYVRWCEQREQAETAVVAAIRTVAAYAAAEAVRQIEWGDYPEIGEGDWARVVDAVENLAPEVPVDDYEAAYELLEVRAEKATSPRSSPNS